MQLSRRARAPGVSLVPDMCNTEKPLTSNTGQKEKFPDHWRRNCETGNSPWSLQRLGCGFDGHCAQDGYKIYIIRGVQEVVGKQGDWNCERTIHISGYVFPILIRY